MSEILGTIQATNSKNLLVGFETADDAGVYRLDDERAVVSTADFITPVVDDPFTFGQVAAANSLSDVYAMGAIPLMALNLLGYPPAGLPNSALGEILAGGADVCRRAGCAVAGGHTVRDEEVKFGLSVTGLVDPRRLLRNSSARSGDRLVLTKPLGTGALVAAMKKGLLNEIHREALITTMTTLNDVGMRLFDLGASACTDVTGFGLTGHALEMATGADATLTINCSALPLLPDAVELCGQGFTCGGTVSNSRFTAGRIRYAQELGEDMIGLLNDPQTSGGLLVAVATDRLDEMIAGLKESRVLAASVIGEVTAHSTGEPHLVFSS